jgi:hypothetical protein
MPVTIVQAIEQARATKEVVSVSATDFVTAYEEIKAVWPFVIQWCKGERDGREGVEVIGYREKVAATDWRIFIRTGGV